MTKIDDVIKFTLKIEMLVPEEDYETKKNAEGKVVLDPIDYKHHYDVSYVVKDSKEYGWYEYTLDEGFIPSFGDDVEELVKEEMQNNFKEITDYEIFDVDNSRYDYQTAKVRIKAVAEE